MQFQKVTVRIAEIDAAGSELPIVAPLIQCRANRDVLKSSSFLPMANALRPPSPPWPEWSRWTAQQSAPWCPCERLRGHRVRPPHKQTTGSRYRWLQPEHALVGGTGAHHVLGMDRGFQVPVSFGMKSSSEPSVVAISGKLTARKNGHDNLCSAFHVHRSRRRDRERLSETAEAFRRMAKTF